MKSYVPFLVWIAVAFSLPVQSKCEDEPDNPQVLWDQALMAKGGKEKLFAVENLLVRQTGGTPVPFYVSLFAFPDKYWQYADERGTVFGRSVRVSTPGGRWTVMERDGEKTVSGYVPHRPVNEQPIIQAIAAFLLDTTWFHPQVISSGIAKIGLTSYDTVTASVGTFKAIYYFDRTTHLLRRLRSDSERAENILHAEYYDFYDYVEVDGIKFPSRFRSSKFGEYRLQFQFNVDYDPSLFSRTPILEDGPDGWKPRARR